MSSNTAELISDSIGNRASMTKDSTLEKYSEYLRSIKPIPWEQQVPLFVEYAQTHNLELERKLYEQYLSLVRAIAFKKFARYGTPIMDIIQDGNIALLNALRSYDVSLGWKFSTYAGRSIVNVVRPPIFMMKSPVKMEAKKIYKHPTSVSMSAPLSILNEDKTVEDTLEDDAELADALVCRDELSKDVQRAIFRFQQDLSPRDRAILHYRVLRDDGDKIDMQSMAWWFGVSKQTILNNERVVERLLKEALRTLKTAA